MIGAAIAGWLATLWMMGIVKNTRIKEDGALGLVLSVFFGFGLMLLTFTQRLPDSRQAGLDHFLFGQAAALLGGDVIAMAALGGLALLLLGLFWKEFKLLSFDREFGASLGFPMGMLDILLTTLLVVAIVIGLQAVGVVLMSAMLVAPAAAARQWTDRLGDNGAAFLFIRSAGRCDWRCHQQHWPRLFHRADRRAVRRGDCLVLDAFCPQSRPDLELGSPAAQPAPAAYGSPCCAIFTSWPGSMPTRIMPTPCRPCAPSAPGAAVCRFRCRLSSTRVWFAAPGQTNGRSPRLARMKLNASCMSMNNLTVG